MLTLSLTNEPRPDSSSRFQEQRTGSKVSSSPRNVTSALLCPEFSLDRTGMRNTSLPGLNISRQVVPRWVKTSRWELSEMRTISALGNKDSRDPPGYPPLPNSTRTQVIQPRVSQSNVTTAARASSTCMASSIRVSNLPSRASNMT